MRVCVYVHVWVCKDILVITSSNYFWFPQTSCLCLKKRYYEDSKRSIKILYAQLWSIIILIYFIFQQVLLWYKSIKIRLQTKINKVLVLLLLIKVTFSCKNSIFCRMWTFLPAESSGVWRYAGNTIDFKHYLNQQTDLKWPSTVITISVIWKGFVEEEMLQGLE